MKKVYLLKVNQKGIERYFGKASAKELVKLAVQPKFNDVQEAQRPLDKKRIKDIADFVTGKEATLSNSIIIGTKDDRITPIPCDENMVSAELKGILYYINLPETEEEYEQFKDSVDLMDGQHRLFAFLDEICQLSEDETFELTFELYIKPTERQRRLIFLNTNEKQKPVPGQLLMWFRFKLNMLKITEQLYYGIVELLAKEPSSPLQNKIIMGGEKIKNGIKSKEMIKILNKIRLKPIMDGYSERENGATDEEVFETIVKYLNGWEKAVGSKISDNDKKYIGYSKIAGIRYMLALLPTFLEIASSQQKKIEVDFVSYQVKLLYNSLGTITPSEFFEKDSQYNVNSEYKIFSSETATWTAADEHSNLLKKVNNEGKVFKPF